MGILCRANPCFFIYFRNVFTSVLNLSATNSRVVGIFSFTNKSIVEINGSASNLSFAPGFQMELSFLMLLPFLCPSFCGRGLLHLRHVLYCTDL